MYRLTYECFCGVLDLISPLIEPDDTAFGDPPTSAAEKLAVCLYFLGHGGLYSSTSAAQHRSRSSVCRYVRVVCAAIIEKVAPQVIRWPTEQELAKKVTTGARGSSVLPGIGTETGLLLTDTWGACVLS